MRGLLVTLEGGEGCGKSTQTPIIAEWFRRRGRKVSVTREPGGTPFGEELRQVLLGGDRVPLDPVTEYFLFATARARLVADVIAPALERGEVVICDRYGDSSIAYQSFGRGLDEEAIARANAFATRGVRPDVTVLLDCPPEVGFQRLSDDGPPDRFTVEDFEFHRRVRAGFLTLARREPERWAVVDASQPAEAVTAAIIAALEERVG